MALKISLMPRAVDFSKGFLNLRMAIWLVVSAIVIGIVGFMQIEQYNFQEAFYMTIITLSTVGYTEVRPLSETGRIFTSVLILYNVGVFTYGASAFTFYVIQGEFFRKLYIKRINKRISKLKDHVIICGYGKYGTEVSEYFHKHQTPFVIIERDEGRVQEIQKLSQNFFFIHDDATKDDVLIKAGVDNAHAIICALPDDTDNLFVVLSARQLNPNICIISRAQDPRSMSKLQLAGATHVIMPEQIGGYYMANLVSKPNATEFFYFISDEIEHDIGFEEVSYDLLNDNVRNKSISELHIREETGANVIGFRQADGTYIVNPDPSVSLMPKTSFIVLGNADQLKKLRSYLGYQK